MTSSEQEPPPGPGPISPVPSGLSGSHQLVLTVAAVARRLGIAPSTLRTWDRRYGLGPSAHTAGSHRRYGPDDVHRLTVMRSLTLEGVPPAEAAQIALGSRAGSPPPGGGPPPEDPDADVELQPSTDDAGGEVGDDAGGEVGDDAGGEVGDDARDDVLDAIRTPGHPGHPGQPGPAAVLGGPAAWFPKAPRAVPQVEALPDALLVGRAAPGPAVGGSRAGGGRVLSLPDAGPRARGLARAAMALDTVELTRLLRDAIAAYGVVGGWESMIAPVLQGLGDRWSATGEGVDVEHAFSEAVLAALRGVTLTLHRPRNPVPVLLAGAEGDRHSLPLHVTAAALAEEGVGCRMLGADVPGDALVAAVRRTGPGVVFLYARLAVAGPGVLRELPRQRPAPRVVVGGPGWSGVALPPTVTRVSSLAEALAAVSAATGG